jgi:hypothetical protein
MKLTPLPDNGRLNSPVRLAWARLRWSPDALLEETPALHLEDALRGRRGVPRPGLALKLSHLPSRKLLAFRHTVSVKGDMTFFLSRVANSGGGLWRLDTLEMGLRLALRVLR